MKILILSDGKPGHANQSIAFARHLGLDYDVLRVSFRAKMFKGLSFVLDWLGIYTESFFECEPAQDNYAAVASAGSATYYAAKTLARRLNIPVVAIMLPSGYAYDFDLIIAQDHDHPPVQANILSLPVNLCYPVAAGLVKPQGRKPVVSLIIGGPSRHFRMDAERLRGQIQRVLELFPGGDFLVTTSRRTPPEVESLVESFPFRYKLIYSAEPVNPVPDFLAISDYVFVTEDSTSMISEAVCTGSACVEILPLESTGKRNKVGQMVRALESRGCVHVFDGEFGRQNEKLCLQSDLIKAASFLDHPRIS